MITIISFELWTLSFELYDMYKLYLTFTNYEFR